MHHQEVGCFGGPQGPLDVGGPCDTGAARAIVDLAEPARPAGSRLVQHRDQTRGQLESVGFLLRHPPS